MHPGQCQSVIDARALKVGLGGKAQAAAVAGGQRHGIALHVCRKTVADRSFETVGDVCGQVPQRYVVTGLNLSAGMGIGIEKCAHGVAVVIALVSAALELHRGSDPVTRTELTLRVRKENICRDPAVPGGKGRFYPLTMGGELTV